MSTVYCETCGASLNEGAKFCRACGASQHVTVAAPPPVVSPPPAAIPAPPPPPPGGFAPHVRSARSVSAAIRAGSILSIVGGLGMCFVTLYAIFYLPLHHHESVNYGESLQFGDLLALGSGLAAIAVGICMLLGRATNRTVNAVVLALAATPTLVLALLWAYPTASHFSSFPPPFYLGFVYFTELGVSHIGSGYIQMPLVASCLVVIASALMIAVPPPSTSQITPYPR